MIPSIETKSAAAGTIKMANSLVTALASADRQDSKTRCALNPAEPVETSVARTFGKPAEKAAVPSCPVGSRNPSFGVVAQRNEEELGGTSRKIEQHSIGKTLGSDPLGTLTKTPAKAGVLPAASGLRKNLRKRVKRQTQSQ